MDPICHTLAGAALGFTGLERKTRFGRLTLIVGANLPDVDVISYAWGETAALGFRRGITHGIPALLVLPVLLAGVMLWCGRRSRPGEPSLAADFRWLWTLSAISVASHPVLDFLNVYGVRWLMPFDGTWFYGDTLYIVDPWMWGILAGGLLFAGALRKRSPLLWYLRPATIGLIVAVDYICSMAVANVYSRHLVRSELSGSQTPRFMVAPLPIDPFRRTVVIDVGSGYRLGSVELLPRPRFRLGNEFIAKGEGPAVELASDTPEGRTFLGWARFPFFETGDPSDPSSVYILDARYTLRRHDIFGAIRIPVDATDTAPSKSH